MIVIEFTFLLINVGIKRGGGGILMFFKPSSGQYSRKVSTIIIRVLLFLLVPIIFISIFSWLF